MSKFTIIKKDSALRLSETLLDYIIGNTVMQKDATVNKIIEKLIEQSVLLSNTMEDRNLTRMLNILKKQNTTLT